MDPFIGELRLFPYGFAPQGWFYCDGSLYSTQQYAALFSLVGFTWGGDGKNIFAVPNMQGRVAVGIGDDPSDTFDPTYGQKGGNEQVTLSVTSMPSHTHTMTGAQLGPPARSATPAGNLLTGISWVPSSGTNQGATPFVPASPTVPAVNLAAGTLSPYVGGGGGHENRQPYLVLAWCIAYDGIYPTKD